MGRILFVESPTPERVYQGRSIMHGRIELFLEKINETSKLVKSLRALKQELAQRDTDVVIIHQDTNSFDEAKIKAQYPAIKLVAYSNNFDVVNTSTSPDNLNAIYKRMLLRHGYHFATGDPAEVMIYVAELRKEKGARR